MARSSQKAGAQPRSLSSPRGRLLIVLVSVGVLAAGVAFAWMSHERRAQVMRQVPMRPVSLQADSYLSSYLDAAEKNARRYGSATDGLAQLGRLYQANGYLAEASQVWEGLHRLEPRNPRWPYLLATILAGYGRIVDALPLLRKTVELAPDYLPARLRLAEALLKNSQRDEAGETFSVVLTKEPDNAYALLGLARIDFAARRWTDARTKLIQITAAHPEFRPAWSLLVTVYEQTAARAAAEEARERSVNSGLRVMPDPWLDELMEECCDTYRLNVAAATTALTDSPGAIRLLRRALEVAPANATSHRMLGEELNKSGDFSGARRHLERATVAEPTADLNWTALIMFLNARNDTFAGEIALAQGLAQCPTSPGLLLERVRRFSSQGRLAESLAILQLLQRLQPDEAEYGVKLALLHFRLDQMADGMTAMKHALVLKPDHPIALLVLARNAIELGEESTARELITRMKSQRQIQPQELNAMLEEFRARFGRAP